MIQKGFARSPQRFMIFDSLMLDKLEAPTFSRTAFEALGFDSEVVARFTRAITFGIRGDPPRRATAAFRSFPVLHIGPFN